MIIRPFVIVGLTWAAAATTTAAQDKPAAAATPAPKRNLQVDDLFRIKSVTDPQISHDSRWVAYTIQTASLKEDKSETQVWMAPTDGGEPLPMTAKGTSASRRGSRPTESTSPSWPRGPTKEKPRTTPQRRSGCSTGGVVKRSG